MTQVAPVETIDNMQGGAPVVGALSSDAKFGTFVAGAPKPTMRSMKLLKNYQPAEIIDPTDPLKKRMLPPTYEIVGWHRPEKKAKDSHGVETIVQTAEFINGEAAPPPYPGVGFPNKLWAGTVVKLPLEEAKRLQSLRLAERDIDD